MDQQFLWQQGIPAQRHQLSVGRYRTVGHPQQTGFHCLVGSGKDSGPKGKMDYAEHRAARCPDSLVGTGLQWVQKMEIHPMTVNNFVSLLNPIGIYLLVLGHKSPFVIKYRQ